MDNNSAQIIHYFNIRVRGFLVSNRGERAGAFSRQEDPKKGQKIWTIFFFMLLRFKNLRKQSLAIILEAFLLFVNCNAVYLNIIFILDNSRA